MKLKQDLFLLLAIVILSIIGLMTLLSTNIDINGVIDWGGVFGKQLIFMVFGGIVYVGITIFDYSYLKHWQSSGLIMVVIILMLIATQLFGPVVNGVQRWLQIGSVQIQPSEIAKVFVIIMTAALISQKNKFNEWMLAGVSFLTLLPVIILIYIEPHGSMSVIISAIWLIMIFTFLDHQFRNLLLGIIVLAITLGITALGLSSWLIGGGLIVLGVITFTLGFYTRDKWRKFFLSALMVGVILGGMLSLGWNTILRDYQKERVVSFFEQDTEDCDNCFNVNQSVVAIGSGGLLGKGFGYGTQSRLNFLPEHQTDFIFATFAEQFGLLGSLFILAIYGFLIIRILFYAIEYRHDAFSSMVLTGIAVKLLLEVFINVGTNVGAIPATGSPLPLMSAGGTITIMTFFSIGLVQSIITHNDKLPSVKDFIDKDDLLI